MLLVEETTSDEKSTTCSNVRTRTPTLFGDVLRVAPDPTDRPTEPSLVFPPKLLLLSIFLPLSVSLDRDYTHTPTTTNTSWLLNFVSSFDIALSLSLTVCFRFRLCKIVSLPFSRLYGKIDVVPISNQPLNLVNVTNTKLQSSFVIPIFFSFGLRFFVFSFITFPHTIFVFPFSPPPFRVVFLLVTTLHVQFLFCFF